MPGKTKEAAIEMGPCSNTAANNDKKNEIRAVTAMQYCFAERLKAKYINGDNNSNKQSAKKN